MQARDVQVVASTVRQRHRGGDTCFSRTKQGRSQQSRFYGSTTPGHKASTNSSWLYWITSKRAVWPPRTLTTSCIKCYGTLPLSRTSHPVLKVREVLNSCQISSYQERRAQMETVLKSSVTSSFYGERSGARFATF